MPAPVRTPSSAWVQQGLLALAGGGPDAVRVDSLAKALGVTRGGFYWHFDDRAALLEAMLDTWERVAVEEAIERADTGGGQARARLRRLFALAGENQDLLPIDLAVRDWARRDTAVAARLRRVDNRRMDYLRALFSEFCGGDAEVEARSLLVITVWVGSSFVRADHGARDRADVVGLIMRRVLE